MAWEIQEIIIYPFFWILKTSWNRSCLSRPFPDISENTLFSITSLLKAINLKRQSVLDFRFCFGRTSQVKFSFIVVEGSGTSIPKWEENSENGIIKEKKMW